jgi:hypothetical protein
MSRQVAQHGHAEFSCAQNQHCLVVQHIRSPFDSKGRMGLLRSDDANG